MLWLIILILIVISLLVLLSLYSSIDLYNTIYFGPNNEQVVVLKKSLNSVTISYTNSSPIEISLIEFILNYHL